MQPLPFPNSPSASPFGRPYGLGRWRGQCWRRRCFLYRPTAAAAAGSSSRLHPRANASGSVLSTCHFLRPSHLDRCFNSCALCSRHDPAASCRCNRSISRGRASCSSSMPRPRPNPAPAQPWHRCPPWNRLVIFAAWPPPRPRPVASRRSRLLLFFPPRPRQLHPGFNSSGFPGRQNASPSQTPLIAQCSRGSPATAAHFRHPAPSVSCQMLAFLLFPPRSRLPPRPLSVPRRRLPFLVFGALTLMLLSFPPRALQPQSAASAPT